MEHINPAHFTKIWPFTNVFFNVRPIFLEVGIVKALLDCPHATAIHQGLRVFNPLLMLVHKGFVCT